MLNSKFRCAAKARSCAARSWAVDGELEPENTRPGRNNRLEKMVRDFCRKGHLSHQPLSTAWLSTWPWNAGKVEGHHHDKISYKPLVILLSPVKPSTVNPNILNLMPFRSSISDLESMRLPSRAHCKLLSLLVKNHTTLGILFEKLKIHRFQHVVESLITPLTQTTPRNTKNSVNPACTSAQVPHLLKTNDSSGRRSKWRIAAREQQIEPFCMHEQFPVYIYVYTYTNVYIYIYTCVYIYTYTSDIVIYIYIHLITYIAYTVYLYLYIYKYVYVYVYVYVRYPPLQDLPRSLFLYRLDDVTTPLRTKVLYCVVFLVYDDTTPFEPRRYHEVLSNVLCMLRH